ncbi:uncharacterized protein LOC128743695 [Sabethes cyaneus]|uniref:uncharacterized protein LOC128743695 n=1 Tax=Sabethes cyaneus TaxID=53552 RepID=UPI00221E2EB8|nr:uncharacterized protein LOC128743695 [Sabethes cyaneus]
MQPDDLSIPRGDSKIKLKLNLHVKKRLQETKKTLSNSLELGSPPVAVSLGAAAGPLATAAVGSKTKRLKTKHSQAVPPSPSVSITQGASCSRGSKQSTELLLSPGIIGGNSNDATNSSFNSADYDPDAGVSNDGQDRADKSGGKSSSKPDIFTLILNEKKSSLMRDPEVIKFLREMMEKRNK